MPDAAQQRPAAVHTTDRSGELDRLMVPVGASTNSLAVVQFNRHDVELMLRPARHRQQRNKRLAVPRRGTSIAARNMSADNRSIVKTCSSL